ncbi:MAG: hypothetical protein OXN97_08465 [Bryobacterales bacterium]|nr:hypothetical protein [Bryobacterales bacterium]
MLYVLSIFTPLEDTCMASGHAMKARELTQLQWEFIMTAWKQSRDFGEMRERSRRLFGIGTKVFYHPRGKHVHGPAFKWPAMRFAGEPEENLAKHLHLRRDRKPNNRAKPPRLIPKHRRQTLEQVARVHDVSALPSDPLRVIVNEGAGESLTESPIRLAVSAGAVGETDLDAAEALGAGAMLADSGVQEGAYGNVEQSGELLGGEAVCGFAD